MSPLELVDDRFGKLASELRASRPVAPETLRQRVSSLSAAEPERPRLTFRLPTRRMVLGLAAAALLVSFVVAGITGLNRTGTQRLEGAGKQRSVPAPRSKQQPQVTGHGSAAQRGEAFRALVPAAKDVLPLRAALAAPLANRLQRYETILRLRVQDVDALSVAARRAMNLTRSLGGYVAAVHYATRGGERGGATLVLRVPVAEIQTALGRLTSLGTILRQETGILDVTRRVDRESRQIAKLERELQEASPEEAVAIRHRLATLRVKHRRLLKSARLARITLTLTTPAKEAVATPSRFDRTLDDAGAVLVRELEILVYALVVGGPLALLGGAAIAAGRAQRRRTDRRLLERA